MRVVVISVSICASGSIYTISNCHLFHQKNHNQIRRERQRCSNLSTGNLELHSNTILRQQSPLLCISAVCRIAGTVVSSSPHHVQWRALQLDHPDISNWISSLVLLPRSNLDRLESPYKHRVTNQPCTTRPIRMQTRRQAKPSNRQCNTSTVVQVPSPMSISHLRPQPVLFLIVVITRSRSPRSSVGRFPPQPRQRPINTVQRIPRGHRHPGSSRCNLSRRLRRFIRPVHVPGVSICDRTAL